MNNGYHNSEKGQAIVYLVIGIVVFLGFVALAIDGGMALADRRNSQNGADAASLAGGGEAALLLENEHVTLGNWNCSTNGDIIAAINLAETTAISRATANNFNIDENPDDHNSVEAACGSTSYPGFVDKYIDVTVLISDTTQSNFLQIIFPEALHNEVEAVTRIRPRQPVGFGNAIVALNTDQCASPGTDGGIMYGDSGVFVDGGGVFSNGCLRGNGQPTIVITDGVPLGQIGNVIPGNADWDPDPSETELTLPASDFILDITTSDCDAADAWVNNLDSVLDPGLYCIRNDLRINASDSITGTGVTIFVPHGDVQINGTADLHLTAPDIHSNPDYAIPGVLFYIPPPNDPFNPNSCPSHHITLNGSEGSWFIGTILAPCADIKLNGTGGNTYRGQVIGWNVEVGGTADTYVFYDPDDSMNLPTTMELAR